MLLACVRFVCLFKAMCQCFASLLVLLCVSFPLVCVMRMFVCCFFIGRVVCSCLFCMVVFMIVVVCASAV